MSRLLVVVLAAGATWSCWAAEAVEIRASIWAYKSLCNFEDPPRSYPRTKEFMADTHEYIVSDCNQHEQKYGHPAAIRLTLKNAGQEKAKMPFEGLDTVVVTAKDGKTSPALAIRDRAPGPMGTGVDVFITDIKGAYSLVLKPGEELDVIFLFRSAGVGDTLRFGKFKPITIK